MPGKLETKDIDGVEIFAAGTWNGDAYTEQDLDEMVRAFRDTKDLLKPYLKLGHDDEQNLAQQDGFPALGWVDNLRRVGKKLVADFRRIPKKIYELIKAGGYRRISSEIYLDIDLEGKKYGKALKAVALLGGDTPAVQTLKDILALYSIESAVSFDEKGTVKTYEVECVQLSEEDENMKTIEQLQAELDSTRKDLEAASAKLKEYSKRDGDEIVTLKAKVDEFTKKNGELVVEIESLKGKNSALQTQVKEFAQEAHEAKVNGDLDKLIQNKKIVPAQRKQAFTMLMEAIEAPAEKKFTISTKDGDKEVGAYEHVLAFMSQGTASVSTKETTELGEKSAISGEELDKKAKEYIESKKKENVTVTYSEALIAVSPKKLPKAPELEGNEQ